jgi:hypothetical protein
MAIMERYVIALLPKRKTKKKRKFEERFLNKKKEPISNNHGIQKTDQHIHTSHNSKKKEI